MVIRTSNLQLIPGGALAPRVSPPIVGSRSRKFRPISEILFQAALSLTERIKRFRSNEKYPRVVREAALWTEATAGSCVVALRPKMRSETTVWVSESNAVNEGVYAAVATSPVSIPNPRPRLHLIPGGLSPGPDRKGIGVGIVNLFLWIAAITGFVAIAITVAATALGFRPVIVKSGSMEPSIPVGAVILVKQVDATGVKAGDVVSVERPDGIRVTHRVVQVEPKGDEVEVILKGDANEKPDSAPLVLKKTAYRVVASLPKAAWPARVMATPMGGFALGLLVAAALLLPRTKWRRAQEA